MLQSRGFSSRCAETDYTPLESDRFREAILGSGHTFKNAEEFRNAIYQMSLGGRFQYKYLKNSPKHINTPNYVLVHLFLNRVRLHLKHVLCFSINKRCFLLPPMRIKNISCGCIGESDLKWKKKCKSYEMRRLVHPLYS